jgi:hypothetical protein
VVLTRLRGDPEIYSESLLAENALSGVLCRRPSPRSLVRLFLLRLQQVLSSMRISQVKDNCILCILSRIDFLLNGVEATDVYISGFCNAFLSCC